MSNRPMLRLRPRHRHHRGFATLAICCVLALVAALLVAWSQRHVWTERRTAVAAERAAQAQAAAEAGVEWLLARLNEGRPIDAQCRPSSAPGAVGFRVAHVTVGSVLAPPRAVTWNDAGVDTPLAAACVRDRHGWQCACPQSGHPTPVVDAGDDATPAAFTVQLESTATPGVLRVVSRGCLRQDGRCADDSRDAHDATARIASRVALLPAVRRAPQAALVAASGIAGTAAFTVTNSGGVAAWSGGPLQALSALLQGPPASSRADALVTHDPDLAALDADRLHARFFGMAHSAWRTQPAVTRVRCVGDCGAAIAAAVNGGAPLVAIDGDADLAGPLTLGSPAAPVAISASGALRLNGDVLVQGVLAATAIDWRGATAAAGVRGAVIAHGLFVTDSPVTLERDPAVLARLRLDAGSWLRVDGSWTDH